ncbi:MAG: MJ1477/TM1410 family putative glycoside hydrolase [Bacteroidota bacterium]|nr:MJ1477/TM1410 family putative glycoside hydrolase [Bacteroidota bacterium]
MKRLQVLSLTVFIFAQAYSQTNLMNVKPWAYWLQTIDIQTIVNDTSFELIVIDYSADGLDSQKWTVQQIDSVKNSGKYAISYISIGEAEDYRYYWQSLWATSPPAWLGQENPNWPGNYAVRFWNQQWQSIVYNYLDTILMQGFDGIYMDLIDSYYYWSEVNAEQPLADSLMCQFVIDIRDYCDSVRGNNAFVVIPQNGEDVWDQMNVSPVLKAAYFDAINGIGVEDVFFPGSLDENNQYNPDTYRIGILQEYLQNNKQVYAIDYLTDTAKIAQFTNSAIIQNYVPYTCTRPLEYLCGGITIVPTELEYYGFNEIHISPNPANEYLRISLQNNRLDKNITIKLHNSIGQLVSELYFPDIKDEIIIDLSGYENGIYFLTVSNNKLLSTFKVIR